MRKDIAYELNDFVSLKKQDGKLILKVGTRSMKIPGSSVAQEFLAEDEEVTGLMAASLNFTVSQTSERSEILGSDDGGEISVHETKFTFDNGTELKDFLGDGAFWAQGDIFEPAIREILGLRLAIGEFDKALGRDGLLWSEEEERCALAIYLGSSRARDSVKMKGLIESAIAKGELMRSYDAVKMHVYNYQSVDRDAGVEGLANASVGIAESLRKHKAAQAKA
jgi:hypothetical protein